ncbi:hypothetical protein D770_19665 [Flammeovirgaceae bacterium 311]|nr:hypothetical protein D770_19665 [Flammeovirgaceae bacterium 311]
MMLAFVLLVAWGCKKDDEPVTTGVLSGAITDADTDAALEGVRIIVMESNTNTPVKSLVTGAEGSYKTELLGGSYYLKLYRQGYDQVPPRNISPLPFTISVGAELAKPYEMNSSELQNGGLISGKITEAGAGVAGVLVVAEANGKGYSAVTDDAGIYYIYNLPAASYTVKGWIGGYTSEQVTTAVTSAAESKQNLLLTRGASGSVNGTITFLATTALDVDVALTHPLTHEPVPGLLTNTAASYTIEGVPAGHYLARATYRNDGRVVDPDWIIKFGEPYVEVGPAAVTRNFSLTNSLQVLNPTNLASTTEPKDIASATPSFSWQAYPSASNYVIEVSDASGNVIWGGIDNSGTLPVKRITIPSSRTSAVFNEDGSATRLLQPGKVYRWKVYVSKNDTQAATGWKLISVSEDQMGLIRIAE